MKRRWLALLAVLLLCMATAHPLRADEDDQDPDQTKEEIEMGKAYSQPFEHHFRVIGSGPAVDRLRRIFKKVAAHTDRTDLSYKVTLLDGPDVNALTFPGGFVYVFRGLMDQKLDDDMLAGILGHELVHAAHSHVYRKMVSMQASGFILGKIGGSDYAAQMLKMLTVTGMGRLYENEADRLAMHYSAAAGYDPRGMLRALQMLQKLDQDSPGLVGHLFATHPPVAERIKKVKEELKKMGR